MKKLFLILILSATTLLSSSYEDFKKSSNSKLTTSENLSKVQENALIRLKRGYYRKTTVEKLRVNVVSQCVKDSKTVENVRSCTGESELIYKEEN